MKNFKKIGLFTLLILSVFVLKPFSAKADCIIGDAPSITITSPNGGETFVAGQQIPVTWTSCNIPEDDNIAVIVSYSGEWTANYTLAWADKGAISSSGSTTYTLLPASFQPGAFQYGTFYKIGISAIKPSHEVDAEDYSNDLFTINSPLSNDATINSTNYTISANGGGAETITNIPFGTSKDTFLTHIVRASGSTWNDSNVTDPLQTGNTLIGTAQDGVTQITYSITVNDQIILPPDCNCQVPTPTPSITITSLFTDNTKTISGTFILSAHISDNTGVVQVNFYNDGNFIGMDTSGSLDSHVSWDTVASGVYNSSHTITAQASNNAGVVIATSEGINIIVDNKIFVPTNHQSSGGGGGGSSIGTMDYCDNIPGIQNKSMIGNYVIVDRKCSTKEEYKIANTPTATNLIPQKEIAKTVVVKPTINKVAVKAKNNIKKIAKTNLVPKKLLAKAKIKVKTTNTNTALTASVANAGSTNGFFGNLKKFFFGK